MILIDVRTPEEFQLGHLPGLNIPIESIDKRINEIDKQKTIIVYCQTGPRSIVACQKLNRLGCQSLYYLEGGLNAIKKQKILIG